MRKLLQEYFQQTEDLPWTFAAFVCACLAMYGIFCILRKYRNRNNRALFPKYLWYSDVIYIQADREYEGYMIEYLSYYSIVVLIMSCLEYLVEDNVGLLARLEMWGIVSAFIGLTICSVAIAAFLKVIAILRTYSVNKNQGLFKPITPYSFARIVTLIRFGAIGIMIIGCVRIASWVGLDILVVIIIGIIPALVMFFKIIAVYIRERDMLSFKEQIENECDDLNSMIIDPTKMKGKQIPSVVKPFYKEES